MECEEEEEEEEDANSLLSLSQTFLQPDSSSASMGLSTNQLHNWSALTSAATEVAGQFSPISPVDGYNTSINTNHALTDNEANVRFYGARSSTSQSVTRSSVSALFNRSVNSSTSASISNNYSSAAKVSGSDFKHGTGHIHLDTSTDLCYDQACGSRSSTNLYGDKDTGYSACSGLNVSSSSLHVNASNVIAASFAHTEYSDEHMLSLTSTSDKLGSRNIQLDQKNFEPRCKQQDYGKDLSNLYDQSAEKHHSTEITMPFDRRDSNAFDSSFEFSTDSRDFMSSARLDVTSVTRGIQDPDCHDSQKYTGTQLGDSSVLSSSLSLDSKRVVSSCMNFGMTGHAEDAYGRLSSSQKKSILTHQLSDLSSDLDPVFHGYHTDFGGHQKISFDSHRNFVSNEFQGNEDTSRFDMKGQGNFKDSNSKWSGRPRAHRKMARLLGSDDHRNYLQTAEANTSHKSSFSKSLEPASQDKSSYTQNTQKSLTSSRTFLTVEEELDLRTNHHQQRNFISRRQENDNRQHMAQRDFSLLHNSSTFLFDSNTLASPMHKDTTSSILASQQFLPSTQLDLDFHSSLSVSQSQKDLDLNQHFGLQVLKGLEGPHPVSNQDDFSFDPSGDAPHVNQAELSLPDNLGIVSHVQPELNFEAYFNSTSDRDFTSTSDRDFSAASDRDLTFCRKLSTSTTRDLNYAPNASVSDFNIEDYMNPQTQRDLSQSYFERTDMPQDMTVYQKTPMDKASMPETLTSFKGREKSQSLTTNKEKQGVISELQKELTKTSTKESLKGIRIPRDINRAMEILQGLQEDEREEERRKELQQRQQYQQHQQMQGLISSPKKTFQNKHNIENSSLTDQQLLGSSGNFMVDHSVGSFLDHSHLSVQEQPSDGLQMVQSYQPLTQMHQPLEVDMVSTLSTKRDLQQNLTQHMASELDYHILKRLACSTSLKSTTTQGSCFSNNSNNLASILDDNHTSNSEMQFQVTGLHYQTQQSDLDDVSNSILNGSSQNTLELNRSKNDVTFMDFEPQQPQHIISEKLQTPVVADGAAIHSSVELGQDVYAKQQTEVLISSRKNLYDMMKQEQFCDAVLSTSKQTIKVHQVVLCSMSQYLTALLQKMKPPLPSYSAHATTSSTSFTSQTTRNESVLLVVNCDEIKSSSMIAFLVYIYLGRAELSENNVLDMYMLACSLRVPTLKDICTEFMWQAHIPNEQIKVPQLIVSIQRFEMQEQATNTDISTEDKFTNTSCSSRGMEVATQTDRSTSKAGEGSQEEWVMLKKTKQKTVSPSKSRLLGKSLTVTDSPISCKAGKKGWLSPKRRYKTENQIEGKITEKEIVFNGKEIASTFPVMVIGSRSEGVNQLDMPQSRFSYTSISDVKTKDTKHESVSQDVGASENKPVCNKSTLYVSKQPLIPKKSARTTVEIAAAAAAAKLAVHSYSTRTARGTMKTPVSYAFLASGLEKKKPVVNVKEKTTSLMSKKKDFIKSNPQADFNHRSEADSVNESDSLTVLLENNFMTCTNTSSQFEPQCVKPMCLSSQTGSEYVPGSLVQLKADAEAFKTSVKRPFKKSIVHRSRSEEVLNKNCVQLASSLATRTDVHSNNESDFMDSYLIDSFVSTMECDNTDVDLQKVINDLDTLTKSPLLTTASSSISSTSLTSPLKSPTALVTTPDFTSPVKSRSTPQGFRKRLIHQINSEKNGSSSFLNIHTENILPNTSSTSPDNSTMVSTSETGSVLTSVSTTTTLSLVPVSPPFTTSLITGSEEACQSISSDDKLLVINKDIAQSSSITNSEPGRDQVATTFTEAVDELALSLYSLEEDADLMLGSKASSFSSMTDIELGLKDDSGGHFFHKLFKRKKKTKTRKPTAADSESTQMKPKLKKLQMSESEGGLAKPRPRKAAGSDTEGSGSRSKQKKNVFSENEGAFAKVRPPPKKRAKMELELLRAGEPDKHSGPLRTEAEDINDRDKATTNCIITDSKSDTSSESNRIREEILKSEIKKSGEGLKKRSPRSTVAENSVTPLSELEVTLETKMTLMLEELAKTLNLKTRQFSCKLCHTKMRSARRTVRHLQSHSVNQEDALENIAIGEKEVDQEACDICGYRTKDRSYHYMHLHKYFKHGVSLPLGWSTDKCEICGKECFTKFQLKEHMMSHDDSHCFVCWHCGQSFKMRNSLNSHVFHKHSDIRKHQCKACGKTFKTWTQLKVHVRSHTGEKPFSCIDCEHRSTTQGNMKLHLSTHGYSKEKIHTIMEKICKDVPEMDPEALEQVMISIAEKVRTEQMTVKEKKSKKKLSKPKPSTGDHVKQESNSPAKTTPEDSSRKKSQNAVEQQDTASGSKFAGSQIKRLLTQPLSQMKPPKFILPQLSQSAETGSNSNEESGQSQVLCDSGDSGLNTLSLLLQTQTQKQDTNGLYGGTFLITLPYSDQQQQQQQPQTVDSLSSMMGYTVIPTYILPNQTRAETLIDSSTGLALSVFSASDILSSGLSMLQPGVQSAELVQSGSIYANNSSSSIVQCAPGSDAAHLLGTSQGHEIQQNLAVTNLQYPDSRIVVIDSTQQENKPDACPSLPGDNSTSTSCSTAVVMLPTESSCSKKSQPLHQQTQTVFNYSPLISSSQSVLLPGAPVVHIIPSGLDTSNFVNFSVTASIPEDVATLNISESRFEDVTAETEHMLSESQEQATTEVTVTHPG